MRAEEGGNQSQRILLIGGPKHGEFMNLPAEESTYEFTSALTLVGHDGKDPWTSFPKTATHVYKMDAGLSRLLPGANVFTHPVLWSSPYHGGFNLHALTKAFEAKDKAEEATKDAQSELHNAGVTAENIRRQRDEARAGVSAADDEIEELEHQLQVVRQTLEMATLNIGMAIQATGRDYQPVTKLPE